MSLEKPGREPWAPPQPVQQGRSGRHCDLVVDSRYQGCGFKSELCCWLSKTCSKLFFSFVFLSVKWEQSFLNLQGVRRMKLTTWAPVRWSRTMAFRVGSLHQGHQHYLGTCCNWSFWSSTPDILSQKLRGEPSNLGLNIHPLGILVPAKVWEPMMQLENNGPSINSSCYCYF